MVCRNYDERSTIFQQNLYQANFDVITYNISQKLTYGHIWLNEQQLSNGSVSNLALPNPIPISNPHLKKNTKNGSINIKSHFSSNHTKNSTEVIGTKVNLKMRPYRQSTMAGTRNVKLAPRYYGPFVGCRNGDEMEMRWVSRNTREMEVQAKPISKTFSIHSLYKIIFH